MPNSPNEYAPMGFNEKNLERKRKNGDIYKKSPSRVMSKNAKRVTHSLFYNNNQVNLRATCIR